MWTTSEILKNALTNLSTIEWYGEDMFTITFPLSNIEKEQYNVDEIFIEVNLGRGYIAVQGDNFLREEIIELQKFNKEQSKIIINQLKCVLK